MSAEAIGTLVNSWYAATLAWGRTHPSLELLVLLTAIVLALRLALWAGTRLLAAGIAVRVRLHGRARSEAPCPGQP